MEKIENVITAMECCAVGAECDHCPYSQDNKKGHEGCYKMHQDALALLKKHKKIKEQLEELEIMENSKVIECDSCCDWDARNYHKGRFDAYNIALAGFNQND